MVHHQPVFACIIRQYGTGLYRSCVSLNPNDSICLSTHPDEKSATETIDQFWQFWETQEQGRTKTAEDVRQFIDSLQPNDPQAMQFQLPEAIEGEIDLAP